MSLFVWGILLIGIAAHLLGFFFYKPLYKPKEIKPIPSSFVTYPKTDIQQVIVEQAWLYDTAPVFLPTTWNYSGQRGENRINEVFTQIKKMDPPFDTFKPNITLNKIDFMEVAALPDSSLNRPSDLLQNEYWNFFSRFGKTPEITALDRRTGHFKIIDMQSGYVIDDISLVDDIETPLDIPPLNPITFLIYIDKWGSIGSPMLLNTSGDDNLDLALRQFTAYHLFGKTPPKSGYYKVLIGP